MFNQFQVTIYPGKGQVEPKVYFGSGPTKKDAKFACGSVAWANIEVIRAHSPALSITIKFSCYREVWSPALTPRPWRRPPRRRLRLAART